MTRRPLHWALLAVLALVGCESEPEVTRAPPGTDSGASAPGSQSDGPQTKRPLKIAD